MTRAIQTIFLIAIISGCLPVDTDYVKFEVPQPSGKKSLQMFDEKIQGNFKDCLDSNTTIIVLAGKIFHLGK